MRILKIAGIIFGSSILGLLLLWAVYLFPTESMVKHVIESEDFLREQDDSEYILSGEYWKATDRGTNIIILHEVVYPNSGNAFQDALLSPTANYSANWAADWCDVLMKYAKEQCYGEDDYVTYARYWHGYLIFLKPLFLFFNLKEIYIINAVVLLGLVATVIVLFKKRLGHYWLIYFFTVLLMNPVNIVQSFQLSSVFYALNITLLLLLIHEWKESQIIYIFTIGGILVAFFDFLTYPYVALAIPLLTYYILKPKEKLKSNIVIAIKNSVSFIAGYVGMWGMKWIFATAFTYENVIGDAIGSVFHRIGITDANTKDEVFLSVSTKDALERNLTQFFNEQNLLVISILFIVICFSMIIARKQLQFDINNILVCGIMAISPFLWIVLLTNHCSLHPHLEWRTLSICVYSIGVCLVSMYQRSVKNNK